MCLYGSSKTNKFNLQNEIRVSANENLTNIAADLHSIDMDYCCLESITWLQLIFSIMAVKWLSTGSTYVYIRLYDWDCKSKYKEHSTTLTKFGGRTCFIHWVFISYYCHSSWSRRGRRLYPLSKVFVFSALNCQIQNWIILKYGDPSLGQIQPSGCFYA